MGTKPTARLVYDSSTVLATTAGSGITFTSVTANTSDIAYENGKVMLKAPGVYRIGANFTTVATAAGDVGVALYEGGNQVPGAKASSTAATIGDRGSLAFDAVSTVRAGAPGSYAQMEFQSIYATSFEVANVIIERVG